MAAATLAAGVAAAATVSTVSATNARCGRVSVPDVSAALGTRAEQIPQVAGCAFVIGLGSGPGTFVAGANGTVSGSGVVTIRVTPGGSGGGTPLATWEARRTALVHDHELTQAQAVVLADDAVTVDGRDGVFVAGFYLDRRSGTAVGDGGREDSLLDVADGATLVEVGVDLTASAIAEPMPGQSLGAAAAPEEQMAVAMATAIIERGAA